MPLSIFRCNIRSKWRDTRCATKGGAQDLHEAVVNLLVFSSALDLCFDVMMPVRTRLQTSKAGRQRGERKRKFERDEVVAGTVAREAVNGSAVLRGG